MNIEQLYKKLIDAGVPEYRFYLHGLFGNTDDNERLSLTIYRKNDKTYYEVYFKERGMVSTVDIFQTEYSACEFLYEKLIYERDLLNIKAIDLEGKTVNERLFASGLIEEFDEAKKHNKRRAREILTLLKVDKRSIDEIVT